MRYLQWLIVGIFTLFPVVMFAVPRGANASFYSLLLIGLLGIAFGCKPMGKSFGAIVREYWPMNLAMTGLVCAIFLNQLALGHFILKTYDMPSRLACFALLFWILLLPPGKEMKNIQWGFVAGSLVCAASLYIFTAGGTARPLRLFKIPIIPFGNIAMLMGVLALLSIGWNERNEKISIALKLAAGGAALYGSYLSQTRGAWLALPLFTAIVLALFRDARLHHKLTFYLAATVLLCSAYAFSTAIQKRINEGVSDVSHYLYGGDVNTSVGIRLQLWRGSWMLYKDSPVFGIGLEQFPRSLQQLGARHELTPLAAAQPHSHNELLFHLTTLGIFGLSAILVLYLVPAFYFWREIKTSDREARTVCGMGLALTLGFLVFGLSDVMFYWSVSHTFYVMVLAVLFAHLAKRKALLAQKKNEPERGQGNFNGEGREERRP